VLQKERDPALGVRLGGVHAPDIGVPKPPGDPSRE
jgi:hypothetical protein